MIYKAVEVIWIFGADGWTDGRESKVFLEVLSEILADLKNVELDVPRSFKVRYMQGTESTSNK